MIEELEKPDGGKFEVGETVVTAYVDQQHESIDPNKTVWLGYAESLFLKAEAALRGWAGADLTMGAEQYFRAGVKASMDYYHIAAEDADKYINGIKALNDGTFESGDRERILEAIITQKWMAVFPNGNEGWADFRRTDYPALRTQLSNFSGGDVPNGKLIKRLQYPNNESQNKFFQEHPELKTANPNYK